MVTMAVCEESGQNEDDDNLAPEGFSSENDEECQTVSRKINYVVPKSFVIHTYSCVQLSPVLSSLYTFYRHKVTMFKKKAGKPLTEAEQIHDEIDRQVSSCECTNKFEVSKVGEGKYIFGDSQKLRLLRILRSVVMVRVGGGWETLAQFLSKNDPCKTEGRTTFDIHNLGVSPGQSAHTVQSFRGKRPGVSREGSGVDLKDGASSPSLGPRKKSGTNLKSKSGELKKAGSQEGLLSPRSTTPTSRVKKTTSHAPTHSDDTKPEASAHAPTTTKTSVTKRAATTTSRVPTPKTTTSRTGSAAGKPTTGSKTSRVTSPTTTGATSRTTTTTTTRPSSGASRGHPPTTKTTSTSGSRASTKSTKTTKK